MTRSSLLLPRRAAAGLLGALLAACQASDPGPADARPVHHDPAPAIALRGTAYETALSVQLPPEDPEEYDGLHNVFRLSENVISGSEPSGRAALERVRDMGVRTILSVDGKIPDAELAAELGLRYVHIPIQYKGVTGDELAQIAKTFRELEGPFYVHCFHGKHRGPAAAAIGRIVVDGVDRATAIAEMRQYCGTSAKYEGLYRDIATAYIPTEEETRALAFDFPSAEEPKGVAGVMVRLSRASDNLDLLVGRAFAADPTHPDLDARNEAEIVAQSYAAALRLDEVRGGAADLRAWFETGHEESRGLVAALGRLAEGDAGAADEAAARWRAVQATCGACHQAYRN